MKKSIIFVFAGLFASGPLLAQDAKHLALVSSFASFVEDDFPFFTQTLDCRKLGENWPADNLTQRGIILKLGDGHFACWDIDMLRVALVWKENEKGEYLSMSGMAPGSYRRPNRKASAGQKSLPVPIGTPLAATAKLPGWGKQGDQRKRKGASADESGLGPAPNHKWIGIELEKAGPKLVYEIHGTRVEERWVGLRRILKIFPHSAVLIHRHGPTRGDTRIFEPSGQPVFCEFDFGGNPDPPNDLEPEWKSLEAGFQRKPLWKNEIKTSPGKAGIDNGFRIEEFEIPLKNPWKRNVRLSAFAFFKNGDAAISTFDGDVWLVTGLHDELASVKWRRYASGLHEPIGLEIVEDEVYVFDRNGITRLHDRNKDGEADSYENFSNVVPQTAETREFANDIVAKPGGGFYLAKGGQQATTTGIANGTIVEVSADGQSYRIICTGLRMPYIGVDSKTGLVTASDQQGNWIPTTPIHVIREGKYYGFQPSRFKEKAVHPFPITAPPIWIPHFVNQSGASQVWLRDATMGPLNDSLILVGYNRPEIFKVYFDREGDEIIQGAVAPVTHHFASGLLKGKVHPIDGSLWLTGFKIWGTSAEQISGLYRITPSGDEIWTPAEVRSEKRGVLLRFHQPVATELASALASYSVDRWNYKRTHNYGSGHYGLDGNPGQETLHIASVKISKDRKSLFLGIPDMKRSHSLRVTYKTPTLKKVSVSNAYLTVHRLRDIDLIAGGFTDNEVDLELSPVRLAAVENVKPTAELGRDTGKKYGCIVCHAAGDHVPAAVGEGGAQVAVGPAWNGLWNAKRNFSDGTELKKVDQVYLRESILDPARKVAKGFETERTGVGMPSYLGVLKDHEIDSVILYIKTLQKVKPKKNER